MDKSIGYYAKRVETRFQKPVRLLNRFQPVWRGRRGFQPVAAGRRRFQNGTRMTRIHADFRGF